MRTFETEPLSVIIVHYGKDRHLLECLHCLSVSAPTGLVEAIVVNNTKRSLREKLRIFPFAKEIFVGQNIGFGPAVNRGVLDARGKFLFFLNPDARILLADTFERMLQTAVSGVDKRVGIVGGGLVDRAYRREAYGGGKTIRIWDILIKRLSFGVVRDRGLKKQIIPLDWVSGASLCIQKEDFSLLGGFDEEFFLYFEDMDLCARMGKMQKKVYYDGSVDILHYGGKSFSKKENQKRHYFESQKKYFQKHRPAWENWVLNILHRIFLRKKGE